MLRIRYKRKIILLLLLMAMVTALELALPGHPGVVAWYSRYIFHPFQSGRNWLFGRIPISIGDLLYVVGFIMMLIAVIRWVYFLIRIRTHAHDLWHSLLNGVISLAIIYVIFFIGWGGNYYKPPLSSYWQLSQAGWDKESLESYDYYLIQKLNKLAPHYRNLDFKSINDRSVAYYRQYTDSKTQLQGRSSKPSVFGYFMQYLGIQGYYNPFTGEAQVNKLLPGFMLPFVVCHEMAHQSGIAAEDDANLLSYALCTATDDTSFAYSGYFNLWLYTHAQLREQDTTAAKALRKTLNPITVAQVDTLRAIRRQYQSHVSDYSGKLYDEYLRLHAQKDGIESYDHVTESAWSLDMRRVAEPGGVIMVP